MWVFSGGGKGVVCGMQPGGERVVNPRLNPKAHISCDGGYFGAGVFFPRTTHRRTEKKSRRTVAAERGVASREEENERFGGAEVGSVEN